MAQVIKDTIKKALCDDTDAQYKVGCWFYENEIMESAHFWIKRAALQGHIEAMVMLEKLNRNKN